MKNINRESENKIIFFDKLNEIGKKEYEILNIEFINNEVINIINF